MMASSLGDTITNFDLSFLHQSTDNAEVWHSEHVDTHCIPNNVPSREPTSTTKTTQDMVFADLYPGVAKKGVQAESNSYTSRQHLEQSEVDKIISVMMIKKRLINTDELVEKYKISEDLLEKTKMKLSTSKEECKKICIDYKNALETCYKLKMEVQALQNTSQVLEARAVSAENQHEGMKSHAKQLQLLLKDHETDIEALKIEIRLEQTNVIKDLENKLTLLKQEKDVLTKHIRIIVDAVYRRKSLNPKEKKLMEKYKKNCGKTRESLSGEEDVDDGSVFDAPLMSPSPTEDLFRSNDVKDRNSMEVDKQDSHPQINQCSQGGKSTMEKMDSPGISSTDTGRGSSLAFSDSDKCFHSPEYFINDSPLNNDTFTNEERATNNVAKRSNQIFDRATSPIIFECSNNNVEDNNDTFLIAKTVHNQIDRQGKLDSNNIHNLVEDNNCDYEIETILNTMRLTHELISPIPSTPAMDPLSVTKSDSGASMPHTNELRKNIKVAKVDVDNTKNVVINNGMDDRDQKSPITRTFAEASAPQSQIVSEANSIPNEDLTLNQDHEMYNDGTSIPKEDLLLNQDHDRNNDSRPTAKTPKRNRPTLDVVPLRNTKPSSIQNEELVHIQDVGIETSLNLTTSQKLLFEEDSDIEENENLNVHNSDVSTCKVSENILTEHENKSKVKHKKISKLDKLRNQMLPKSKIQRPKALPLKRLVVRLEKLPLYKTTVKGGESSASLNDKVVYDKAVKIMSELNAQRKGNVFKNGLNDNNNKVTDKSSLIREYQTQKSSEHRKVNDSFCTDSVTRHVTTSPPRSTITTRSRTKSQCSPKLVNGQSQSEKISSINAMDKQEVTIADRKENKKTLKRTSVEKPEFKSKRMLRSSAIRRSSPNNNTEISNINENLAVGGSNKVENTTCQNQSALNNSPKLNIPQTAEVMDNNRNLAVVGSNKIANTTRQNQSALHNSPKLNIPKSAVAEVMGNNRNLAVVGSNKVANTTCQNQSALHNSPKLNIPQRAEVMGNNRNLAVVGSNKVANTTCQNQSALQNSPKLNIPQRAVAKTMGNNHNLAVVGSNKVANTTCQNQSALHNSPKLNIPQSAVAEVMGNNRNLAVVGSNKVANTTCQNQSALHNSPKLNIPQRAEAMGNNRNLTVVGSNKVANTTCQNQTTLHTSPKLYIPPTTKEVMDNNHNNKIVDYNDIDIFTDEPGPNNKGERRTHAKNAENQLSPKIQHPQESTLCLMIEKYGITSVKCNSTKISDSIINSISKKIEEDIAQIVEMPQNGAKQAMNTLTEDLLKWSLQQFLMGFNNYLVKPERKNELFSKVNTPPAPPMSKQEQVLLYVITRLKCTWPDIFERILTNIEYTLYKLNRTPEFNTIESMAHFYAVICRYIQDKSRLRVFILDAMYCIQYKAVPLIRQCLDVWMHILPLAHMGIAKSALVTCLVYLLNFFKCEDKFSRVQDIRNILTRKYSYQLTDWNETKILEMFTNSIEELTDNPTEQKMLRLALIILAKRQGPKWCQNNIIKKMLQPMIEKTGVPERVKLFCVSVMGSLLKPYPVEMKVHCEIAMNQLIDMLDQNPSPQMQEAIFTSLIYMSKHNQNRVIQTLLLWGPKKVSREMESLLKDYVREKPMRVWKIILSKISLVR